MSLTCVAIVVVDRTLRPLELTTNTSHLVCILILALATGPPGLIPLSAAVHPVKTLALHGTTPAHTSQTNGVLSTSEVCIIFDKPLLAK